MNSVKKYYSGCKQQSRNVWYENFTREFINLYANWKLMMVKKQVKFAIRHIQVREHIQMNSLSALTTLKGKHTLAKC